MRLKIQDKDVEIRVQERRVVYATAFHKGVEIAACEAICAPDDVYNPEEGEKLAVGRLAAELEGRQWLIQADKLKKVDQLFRDLGAISGQVEFPTIFPGWAIAEKILGKLTTRREKKTQEAKAIYEIGR